MTAQRPDGPTARAEEIALAESRDLPPHADGAGRRTPIAKVLEAERLLDPKGPRR